MGQGPRTRSLSLPRHARRAPDLATLIGLVGAAATVSVALWLGGTPESFVNVPSILIVFGGTLFITMVSFRLKEIAAVPRVTASTFARPSRTPDDVARAVLSIAEQARKHNLLGLEGQMSRLSGQMPFLSKGLAMVMDGLPLNTVHELMERDMLESQRRSHQTAAVLRRAGEVAPAMGLIGTLIGLIQMLGRLSDPAAIGPAMAVALLTTFYGALLAGMVFNPLAAKLQRNAAEEDLVNRLYAMGVLSIAKQENPRQLELELNSALPPAMRIKYFD